MTLSGSVFRLPFASFMMVSGWMSRRFGHSSIVTVSSQPSLSIAENRRDPPDVTSYFTTGHVARILAAIRNDPPAWSSQLTLPLPCFM